MAGVPVTFTVTPNGTTFDQEVILVVPGVTTAPIGLNADGSSSTTTIVFPSGGSFAIYSNSIPGSLTDPYTEASPLKITISTVLEALTETILAELNTLKAANGANYDLTFVRHSKLDNPTHLQGILFQSGQRRIDGDDPEYGPYAGTGCDAWFQIFNLVIDYLPAEGDTSPIDLANNLIWGDVYTQLKADFSQGGLAGDTQLIEQVLFPSIDGEFGGQTIRFGCLYRHVIDNPYFPVRD